jgi:hypothetical protein
MAANDQYWRGLLTELPSPLPYGGQGPASALSDRGICKDQARCSIDRMKRECLTSGHGHGACSISRRFRSAMNVILRRIHQHLSPQSFPDTAEDLAKRDLFTGRCYYSVELMPGLLICVMKSLSLRRLQREYF